MAQKMRVEYWDIDKVIPYENNPRNNDEAVEKVANSLKEFGWKQPIVTDVDGVVIAGHTRLKAARYLNMEQVPVLVASDLTPAQAAAYRLADNKTAELATWDFDLLNVELEGLEVDFDMTSFGFNEVSFEPSFGDANEEYSPDESVTVKVLFHDAKLYQRYRQTFSEMESDGASVSIS